MPRLQDTNLEDLQAGSGYKFSGTKIEKLGASKYTLVGIVCDVSGSVEPFAKQIEMMLGTIVKSCDKSAFRDNLMVRLTIFSHLVHEVHGFKLLSTIKPNEYDGMLVVGGSTALFNAGHEGVTVIADYGKALTAQDFLVNGILFIITDGEDREGGCRPSDIAKAIKAAKLAENLESIRTILVGVTGDDTNLNSYLERFKAEAEIDQYISIGTATPGKLGKLAEFASQSVSSTSQSLGTGGPSQPITF